MEVEWALAPVVGFNDIRQMAGVSRHGSFMVMATMFIISFFFFFFLSFREVTTSGYQGLMVLLTVAYLKMSNIQ